MTDEERLVACKKGLNIPTASTDFDDILNQKLLAVKLFMTNAGVSTTSLDTDLGVGALVLGVADLWELKAGEVKFSPAFFTLTTQLALGSSVVTVTSDPEDGDVDVSVAVDPKLTFSGRVSSYAVSLVKVSDLTPVTAELSLDITAKVLTITPEDDLDAATEYAIVVSEAISTSGPGLSYTVIQFTTA